MMAAAIASVGLLISAKKRGTSASRKNPASARVSASAIAKTRTGTAVASTTHTDERGALSRDASGKRTEQIAVSSARATTRGRVDAFHLAKCSSDEFARGRDI